MSNNITPSTPRKNICVILLSSSQSNKNMSAYQHISIYVWVCVFVCYYNHLGNVWVYVMGFISMMRYSNMSRIKWNHPILSPFPYNKINRMKNEIFNQQKRFSTHSFMYILFCTVFQLTLPPSNKKKNTRKNPREKAEIACLSYILVFISMFIHFFRARL